MLLLLCLRTVLVEELEELGRGVLVKSVRELSNGGGDLETLVKDDLLTLETDILRPFDEASQIGLRLDALTYKDERETIRYALRSTIINDSPIPKFFGFDSKRGFFCTFEVFAPGAGAGFLPVFALGAWSLRRVQMSAKLLLSTAKKADGWQCCKDDSEL